MFLLIINEKQTFSQIQFYSQPLEIIIKILLTDGIIIPFLVDEIICQKFKHQSDQVAYIIPAECMIKIEANAVIVVDTQGFSGALWHPVP